VGWGSSQVPVPVTLPIQLSLPAPQLAKPHEPFSGHGRSRRHQFIGRRRQLALRFLPCASPHADRCILRPADGKQRAESPFRAPRLEPIAPLHGAIEIMNPLAGGDEVAAGQADENPIGHLAGKHSGIDLVELPKAVGDVSAGDAGEAVKRATDHLVVHGSDSLSDPHRFRRQLLRFLRISIIQKRKDTCPQRQPRVLRRIGLSFKETACALEPAAGHGLLAAKSRGVPGKPHGHARSGRAIVALEKAAIGAFPRVEYDVGKIEPPGRKGESFERFGVVALLQAQLERLLCLLPVAALERGLSVRHLN